MRTATGKLVREQVRRRIVPDQPKRVPGMADFYGTIFFRRHIRQIPSLE